MRHKKSTLLAGLATLVCTATALNGAAPGFAGTGHQSGAPKASSCTLAGSAHSKGSEFLSCLGVSAQLDRLPAVGQTARLTVQVRSSAELGADVSVQLPPNLEWVQAPSGMTRGTTHSVRPETAGRLDSASAHRAMSKGDVASYTGIVRATAAGEAQIRANATAAYAGHTEAGSDSVFLTVGQKSSTAGFDKKAVNATAKVPDGVHVAGSAKFRSVTTHGLTQPGQAGAPCDTHVIGQWTYQDQNGTWRAGRNIQVQAWNGGSELAVGVTDGTGHYNLCYDGAVVGTANIFVKFITENSIWRVQRGGNPMAWNSGTSSVAPGTTVDKGNLTTGDSTLARGLHAFDEVNDAWMWIPKPHNLCFDQDDSSCRQVKVNWAPDSTDGTYYSLGGNDVHLAADDPNAAITVVHETGHAIMDDVYNDAFPSAPSCNPHSIQGATSQGCAWTEGWAEWFPATVYNDPFFRWASGASLNLETPSWGNGWSNGDATEGRVAGAMIDLTDSTNEGPWDRVSEGPIPIWNLFMTNISNTFGQFWGQRAAAGGNVSQSALATLFTNTIDYGFRDPMANYVQLSRPSPITPHNFSFNTTTHYWQVDALKPNAGSSVDLALYDNFSLSTLLKTSTASSNTIDFIAIDSNRRALGDYYPRVTGSGAYLTELAQGSTSLPVGSQSLKMGSSDVVVVRDVFMSAGQKNTIKVIPGNSGQNPSLFLLTSTSSSSTWVKSRAQSTKAAFSNGPGAAETFTYTPSVSGWYGVVVLNQAGSGSYTLKRTVG
jgi:hypothetical protein